ncbi:MAG: helix-turn-helix domain-containing protein [Bacteroidota bacterium]
MRLQRICSLCGNEFTAQTTTTQYCGNVCSKRAYKARKRAEKIEASNTETVKAKERPIDELKAKAFLSVPDTCKLLGLSRWTVYRMIARGQLLAAKAGTRTIVRRSDLDSLFIPAIPQVSEPDPVTEQLHYELSECYSTEQVRAKFGITDKALSKLLFRNKIPKYRNGRYAYVPQVLIDKVFIQKIS